METSPLSRRQQEMRGRPRTGPLWGGGRFVILLLICLMQPIAASRLSAQAASRANVGYRVLEFTDKKSGTVTVAVWYPTAAKPKRHCYGGTNWGMVAVEAEPLARGAPYPLLVFSHGYSGSGLGAVFFTEALAARGWIVACADHHDPDVAMRIRGGRRKDFSGLRLLRRARRIASSGPADRGEHAYRLEELKLTLDRMLTTAPFAKLIDAKRVAVGGHSLGGFTALGLCGTIKERREPRIKALLLFSTGAGAYLYTAEELRRVRIATMTFIGERERRQRRGDKTMAELADKLYGSFAPPKYYLEVKAASHFSFNSRFRDTRLARRLSGSPEQHDVIRRYSIAFLERHVAGREDPSGTLDKTDPMLTRYRKALPPAPTAKGTADTGR